MFSEVIFPAFAHVTQGSNSYRTAEFLFSFVTIKMNSLYNTDIGVLDLAEKVNACMCYIKTDVSGGCRDGSMVRSICCSCKEPKFSFCQPCGVTHCNSSSRDSNTLLWTPTPGITRMYPLLPPPQN